MAHPLASIAMAAVPATRIQSTTRSPPPTSIPSHSSKNDRSRRMLICSLVSMGLGMSMQNKGANAASRRAPPPPQAEKKDPNISGVQAKVLASIKRKEAMKEAIAKLREKGQPVN